MSYAAFSRAGTLQRLNQDKVHTTMTGVMSGGRLEGPGTTRYADGTTYEGHHVAGQRSGKGVMHWPNGRVHDGDWANGVPHGKGVFTEKPARFTRAISRKEIALAKACIAFRAAPATRVTC